MKKVVITGVGVVSPIGIGKEAYWESLSKGRHGFSRITRFDSSTYPCQIHADVKNFDVTQFGVEKKGARRMDLFTQFAMAAAKMAVEDAGLNLQQVDPERAGVIVGSGIGGLPTIESQHSILLEKGINRVTPFLIPMLITNIAPGEIAISLGFVGPNYSCSSACATANQSIGAALRHLRYGDADLMIAGGTEGAITPLGVAGFCQAQALTFDFNDNPGIASRPFDAKRSGFVMGEGAGLVVLETEEHAKKRGARIYAELAGYGATDDAFHITAPSPEGKAAVKAIQLALQDGNINADEVDYINAHGTSTPLNDKTETKVIKMVFGERAKKIPISSTKSMTGHLLGAAGGVELIATLLSMQNNLIHPTINYENADPECDLDYVPNTARPGKITCAVSNSLGFGGHNAVLVVKKYGNT
ncbi:MAG: 3-oxoacyl-[acyl-carrier-protein] synthase 2 [Elusimicrobia bacterium]|nr:3-oxoacyl-[acyl-carrier-protein] synthase 2 [Elusimicrobiota bacterium]